MLSIAVLVGSRREEMGRLQGEGGCRARRGEVFGRDSGSILCEGGYVDGEWSEESAISGGEGGLACLQAR